MLYAADVHACLLYTSKVDMIVIMYDLNDYKDKRPVMDENNDINLLTWDGALNASIPVSYTHLDVYKRQGLSYTGIICLEIALVSG